MIFEKIMNTFSLFFQGNIHTIAWKGITKIKFE